MDCVAGRTCFGACHACRHIIIVAIAASVRSHYQPFSHALQVDPIRLWAVVSLTKSKHGFVSLLNSACRGKAGSIRSSHNNFSVAHALFIKLRGHPLSSFLDYRRRRANFSFLPHPHNTSLRRSIYASAHLQSHYKYDNSTRCSPVAESPIKVLTRQLHETGVRQCIQCTRDLRNTV
jgi:hypothetical protein